MNPTKVLYLCVPQRLAHIQSPSNALPRSVRTRRRQWQVSSRASTIGCCACSGTYLARSARTLCNRLETAAELGTSWVMMRPVPQHASSVMHTIHRDGPWVADDRATLKGHRDGHHDDRPPERRQDLVTASVGRKLPPVVQVCGRMLSEGHSRVENSRSSRSLRPVDPVPEVDIPCFKLDPNSRLQHEAGTTGPRDPQMVSASSDARELRPG